MSERKRRLPKEPALSTTAKLCFKCNPDDDLFGVSESVEQQVNWSIWRSLLMGDDLRLAVKCHRCGRWIHHPDSKRAHRDRCTKAGR